MTHVYGLTETAPLITFCEPLPEHKTLSLHERAQIKARQGVELVSSGELKVVDDDGIEVPHDGQTLGEITVRGNVVMKGYYNDPEATSAAIKNGWFHSGDAAVVHPDGYIEIRDRFKDIIISGGENISSVEIEGCLLRHPAVQEVAVVGRPHQRWGESPHAFVILRQGAGVTEDELRSCTCAVRSHTSRPRSGSASSTSCRRRRRARCRSSCCAPARLASRDSRGTVRGPKDRPMTGRPTSALVRAVPQMRWPTIFLPLVRWRSASSFSGEPTCPWSALRRSDPRAR